MSLLPPPCGLQAAARAVSKFKPMNVPVIAFVPTEKIARQLQVPAPAPSPAPAPVLVLRLLLSRWAAARAPERQSLLSP